MALKKLKLTLNPGDSNERQYIISNIINVNFTQEKPSSSIKPPGDAPEKNTIMALQGQTRDPEIRFSIHNDGTDKSNGTSPSEIGGDVVTIIEQIIFLRDYIDAPEIESTWTLVDNFDDSDLLYGPWNTPSDGMPIIVNSVDTNPVDLESPKWRECRIQLKVGKGVSQ